MVLTRTTGSVDIYLFTGKIFAIDRNKKQHRFVIFDTVNTQEMTNVFILNEIGF